MLRAPRFRIGVLLVAIASLLVGPSSPAEAQVGPVEVEAVVTGRTDPNAFPPTGHTLGVNRVSGPSRFRSGQSFTIAALVVCPGATSVNLVSLTSPHPVTFWADDDITDGYGEISTTDTSREFEGNAAGGNAVRVRIEETGRFHRLLGVVEVDLTLDVRVTGPAGNQICHDPRLPFRIIFELLPQSDPPGGPGFTLVGIGRRHITGAVDDRTSVARTVCGLVGPAFRTAMRTINGTPAEEALEAAGARITDDDHRLEVRDPFRDAPPPVGPRPGRGPFHPCPPEGQTN